VLWPRTEDTAEVGTAEIELAVHEEALERVHNMQQPAVMYSDPFCWACAGRVSLQRIQNMTASRLLGQICGMRAVAKGNTTQTPHK
jgi:hypothetical protein